MDVTALAAMLRDYPVSSHRDYRNALKEILQHVCLLALWRARFFEHAAFYGGTALRILHGLPRFSEDLDFSLLVPSQNFALSSYCDAIVRELSSLGLEVEISAREKAEGNPVQSAFLKANTREHLIQVGLPDEVARLFHRTEVSKVKFEIDTDPPPLFMTETQLVVGVTNVPVRAYTLPDLFAGKIHALLYRNWKRRVKGRDWFDFAWLVGRGVPVRLSHLAARMHQSGNLPADSELTEADLRRRLAEAIDSLDVEAALMDVTPFVRDARDLEMWSCDFFHQVAAKVHVI